MFIVRTMTSRPSQRIYRISASVAVVSLVAAGVAFRELERRLGTTDVVARLAAGTLARLPVRIGDWTGRDVPLPDDIIRATDTDDHVSRSYSRGGSGMPAIGCWIGYGARARDLAPHRPDVCYPGAGWIQRDISRTDVPLADGSRLPCTIHRFSRGGLDAREIVVLNYYLIDGEQCPDISRLRSRLWRGGGAVQYMAQVQISCAGQSALGDADSRIVAVKAFAADSAAAIGALFVDALHPPHTGVARAN